MAEAQRRAEPLDETTIDEIVSLGVSLIEHGHYNEALGLIEECLEQEPSHIAPLLVAGRAMLGLGRDQEALEVLLRALRLAPQDVSALRWLAEVLARRGDVARVEVLVERGRALAPDDPVWGSLLSRVAGAIPFEAERSEERALRESGWHRIALKHEGIARLKEWARVALFVALVAFSIAVWFEPALEVTRLPSVEPSVEVVEPQWDEASERARLAEIEALITGVQADAAFAALEALPPLEGNAGLATSRARLWTELGEMMLRDKRRRAAARALEYATSLEGAPVNAWFFLGEAYAGRNTTQATRAYQRYLALRSEGRLAQRARRALGQ